MCCWSVQVVLLGVMILTAVAQDSEEKKKEEEDIGRDGRGPPQNVTVTAGVTSLTVSWYAPDKPPPYYIVNIDNRHQETQRTLVVFNNLQPCTSYDIFSVSVYEGESYLTYDSGRTLDSVPPPPQSCWFDNITSTTMTLYWQDVDFACPIISHNISLSWDVLWSDDVGSDITNTTITGDYITLLGIPPYTNVTAQVAAVTDVGYGPSTSCWNVTSQDETYNNMNIQDE
ncbi:phosphatidylinositol phosphatase PTPRQ isoform X2 [Cherax quadricarinatus]|uniref:phosphatidylinositol phosphatase PTPRQ isoform X2 n=1 Tax=Cherax quadricarinatus TaxID=27406 RepID=UPI00387E8EDC